MPILDYIQLTWYRFLLICGISTLTMFFHLLFSTGLYSCRPHKLRLLAVSAVLTVVQIGQIFITYSFWFPAEISIPAHAFLIFANPLLLLIAYPLLKGYARIPLNRCIKIATKSISFLNMSRCLFLIFQEHLISVREWTDTFSPDLLASASTLLFAAALLGTAQLFVRRKNIQVKTPEGLLPKRHAPLFAFIELSVMFVFLILFRMLFMSQTVHTPYEIIAQGFHYISYIVLIMIWCGYYILDVFRDVLLIRKCENETLVSHISALNDANEQFRGVKHDFNNILQGYGSLIEVGNLDRLGDYHRSVCKTTAQAAKNVDLSQKLRHYPPLYALLMDKEGLAAASEVEMSMDAALLPPGLPISDVDLCRIVGVLLDNAIESAAESKKRHVAVTAEFKELNAVWIISNSCDRTLDLRHLFAKDYTTKGAGRGLGLYEVGRLLRKNRSVSIQAKQFENMVTFYVILEYPAN